MMQSLHKYRKYIWLGLLVQVIAAWFSIGFHHPDEHFQVLEFCGYKLGITPATDLPWEFAAQIRPALQPLVAYCLSTVLIKLGLFNPFMVAFLLRLVMGVFTWWVTCRLVAMLLPGLDTIQGRKIFVLCSFFLWFVPYTGVRFSAENIAGLLFLLSLTIVLPGAGRNGRLPIYIVAGFLFGASLFLRIQMGFALLALVAWALRYRKWSPLQWLLTVVGGALAIGLCVLADHWFYGTWLFSPWNYFQANVIQHKAAGYGVYPVWFYVTEFINIAVPPLSIALLLFFFYGLWEKRNHLFSWITIVFIIGHSLPVHKELRFLFPLIQPFIFISCCGIDALVSSYAGKTARAKQWLTTGARILVVVNYVVLFIKMFTPASESISYLRFIYNYAKDGEVVLMSVEKSPYWLHELNADFYKSLNVRLQVIDRHEQIDSVIKNNPVRPVLFLSRRLAPDTLLKNCSAQQLFCLVPGWVSYFNFGDWESRSNLWILYRLK